MTESANRLHDLVSHAPADRNLAAAASSILFTAPDTEQAALFYQLLLEYKYTNSDASMVLESYFNEEEIQLYGEGCTQLLDQWMEELQAAQLTEEDFHSRLWQNICAPANERLRTMMVAVCAADERLPYLSPARTAEGDGYTSESFKAAAKQIDPVQMGLVHHILQQDYERVSQDAAALLPLLETCPTPQEKVLLLSTMFLAVHQKIQLSELQASLRKAADEALEQLIRETIEEYEGDD